MKIVAVGKIPLELRGEKFADSRLAGSGGAHQENDHGNIIAGYGFPRNSPSSMWKW
jgi:hypothetical protein